MRRRIRYLRSHGPWFFTEPIIRTVCWVFGHDEPELWHGKVVCALCLGELDAYRLNDELEAH